MISPNNQISLKKKKHVVWMDPYQHEQCAFMIIQSMMINVLSYGLSSLQGLL